MIGRLMDWRLIDQFAGEHNSNMMNDGDGEDDEMDGLTDLLIDWLIG